ncbi:MAG TPA: hypothetical protein VF695_06380 [Sphingomonas sp.]|jgi:transposase InsO family protein
METLVKLLGALFVADGRECVYRGPALNGRHMIGDGGGWMFEVPDPVSGLPMWPTTAQFIEAMATRRLVLRSNPLQSAVRNRGRRKELTREELVNAKKKDGSGELRDRWFTLRESAIKIWEGGQDCALTKKGVARFFEDHFDVDALKAEYGRLPSDTTFRTWIRTRGLPNDHRPADFASESGIGPRRRKIDPVVLAIIKHYALSFHSKPLQFVNTYFRKAKDDVERYAAGKKLAMYEYKEALDKPEHEVKMCVRRIFTKEVEKARSAKGLGIAYNQAAARQRYGGGGVAQEPTRFLEYVQIDDTPFPMVFIIDPVRRFPVGVPTVTIALDVFTRAIVGWDISFDPPGHATYMRTLLSIATPKRVPEGFETFPELAEVGGKIVGHAVLDNAKHQTARSAQDAGGDIGQAVRAAGSKEPTHKAHVERCIGTLEDKLREMLSGGTWDIPLMREFDYDPSTQAIVTIEDFRVIFAKVVAWYHTHDHTGLGERPSLDVWTEQRAAHGLDWVHDIDQFERAIGNVYYPSFRGAGAVIEGLTYGGDDTDERFPHSNVDILHHLALARGASSDTKKPTYKNVKIKVDPNDIGRAWLFDEHLFAYIPIPCTLRRYSDGLPLWLHLKIKEFARARGLAFAKENDMLTVRENFAKAVDAVIPSAGIADRHAAARLADSAEGRAFLGDALEVLRVAGSPSGMEGKIAHDLRIGTRGDANRIAPRSSSRNGTKDTGRRDRRGTPLPKHEKPETTPAQQERQDWEDAAYLSRRLDPGGPDGGYQFKGYK